MITIIGIIAGVVILTGIFVLLCGSGVFGKWGQFVVFNSNQYNEGADMLLKKLLDQVANGEISAKNAGRHTITLGDYKVWIANKYFSYASSIGKNGGYDNVYNDVRVSYKQAMRLIDLENYVKVNGPIKAKEE